MMKVVYFLIGLVLVLVIGMAYYPSDEKEIAINKNAAIVAPPFAISNHEVLVVPNPNPHIQKMLTDFEKFVNQSIATGQSPGAAVAIVKDTSLIYLHGFGVKQAGTENEVDVNTVFRLGSVSKSFAAVLTGTLVNDHVFSWDDPVTRYLPDFHLKVKANSDSLTIRHVLSHTIGLPYHAFTNLVEEHVPLDTLIDHLYEVDLIGVPGKVYSYQNVGYSLISPIIKSATGKSYEEELKERIFEPLYMKNASASYKEIKENKNVALPHHRGKRGWAQMPISDTYYNVTPAGGVNASISDMGLWLKALMGNRQDVLANAMLKEVFKPEVKAISKNRNMWLWKRPSASYYAMGWRVIVFKQDTLLYHGGYVNGYRSEIAIHPNSKLGICVLTNAPSKLADTGVPQFLDYYANHMDSINSWEDKHKLILTRK
jgi:beta-lactamase class C